MTPVMRIVLFFFWVQYVSVKLCQKCRLSLIHRVGLTRVWNGALNVTWSSARSSQTEPKQTYLLTEMYNPHFQSGSGMFSKLKWSETFIHCLRLDICQYTSGGWLCRHDFFSSLETVGCLWSQRGAKMCLRVSDHDLHPVITRETGQEMMPRTCLCSSSEVK